MGNPRIVIVGGGSYHWAPRLLCDFRGRDAQLFEQGLIACRDSSAFHAPGGALPGHRLEID